jgi:hypothetical protein
MILRRLLIDSYDSKKASNRFHFDLASLIYYIHFVDIIALCFCLNEIISINVEHKVFKK